MINAQELPKPTKEKVLTPEKIYEVRIQAFDTFFKAFKPTLNTIYYPGSNTDISPSETTSFKGSRVIYVDTDEKAIQTLKGKQYEAYLGNAENFNPGEVNLLLLLNFYDEKPLKYVVEKGYIMCNDHWTGTLRKILGKNDFELAGVFTDENQELKVDEKTLREEALRINSQTPNPSRNMANLFVFRKNKSKFPI